MPITLHCHPGIGQVVEGVALVADDNFSARYDLDRCAAFSLAWHISCMAKITLTGFWCCRQRGGVASAWMLRDMVERGIMLKALLFNSVNPILAQELPLETSPSLIVLRRATLRARFSTGDRVRVEPETGVVTILTAVPIGEIRSAAQNYVAATCP